MANILLFCTENKLISFRHKKIFRWQKKNNTVYSNLLMLWDLVFKYSHPTGPNIPPQCHPTPHLFKMQMRVNGPYNSVQGSRPSCTFDNKFSLIVSKQGDDNQHCNVVNFEFTGCMGVNTEFTTLQFHPCVFFSLFRLNHFTPHPTHQSDSFYCIEVNYWFEILQSRVHLRFC